MPVSHWRPDATTKKLLSKISIDSFLDVGAGAGKYGKMVANMHPSAERTCIEIDSSYIEKYSLTSLYHKVLNIPAIDLLANVDSSYDLVIIGDCIEHMRKSEGIDLLNFLIYRSKYILVIYPVDYLQNSVDGHQSEAHISLWSESDFAAFSYKLIVNGDFHSYAINGLQQNRTITGKIFRNDKTVQSIFC